MYLSKEVFMKIDPHINKIHAIQVYNNSKPFVPFLIQKNQILNHLERY